MCSRDVKPADDVKSMARFLPDWLLFTFMFSVDDPSHSPTTLGKSNTTSKAAARYWQPRPRLPTCLRDSSRMYPDGPLAGRKKLRKTNTTPILLVVCLTCQTFPRLNYETLSTSHLTLGTGFRLQSCQHRLLEVLPTRMHPQQYLACTFWQKFSCHHLTSKPHQQLASHEWEAG